MTVLPGTYGRGFFDGVIVLPETSRAACALASSDGWLWLAWTGGGYRVNVLSSPDGQRFAGKWTLDHTSTRGDTTYRIVNGGSSGPSALAPALMGTGHDGVQLAWTGSDSQLNLWSIRDYPEGHVVVPQHSGDGPALGLWDGAMTLAWTGTDGRLNLSLRSEGRFGEPWTLDETSLHPPAITSLGPELVLAWTGTDRQLNLVHRLGRGRPEPWYLGERSDHAPAMCVFEGDLVLAWTGTMGNLNLLRLHNGIRVAHVVFDALAVHAPAICVHHERLFIAWTAQDRRLNLARIHPAGIGGPPRG